MDQIVLFVGTLMQIKNLKFVFNNSHFSDIFLFLLFLLL